MNKIGTIDLLVSHVFDDGSKIISSTSLSLEQEEHSPSTPTLLIQAAVTTPLSVVFLIQRRTFTKTNYCEKSSHLNHWYDKRS